MKNLVLGSLIALTATQAAGCIITSGNEDAFITASWTFRDEATNTTTGCPSGFDTVALYTQSLDGGDCDPTDAAITDTCIELFSCSLGGGTSAPLHPTSYLAWIEVATADNSAVYAKSTSAVVDVTNSDKSFAAQILNDGGYFEFAWDLRGANTNAPLSCADAPAGVDLTATVSGTTESNSDVFDCEDGRGITAGYRAAAYTISISALSGPDLAVGVADEIEAAIMDRNRVTDLGTVQIPIDGR